MESLVFAKHKALYVAIVCFLIFSFACSSNSGVTPTAIPSVTNTPEPTVTIPPSVTPIPSATPTPLVVDLGQVVVSESFDDVEFPFNVYGPKRVESGVLVLEREEGYQPLPDMWPTNGFYGTIPAAPGVTTIILFKATGTIHFNIGYHTGEYGTESLRRFNYNSSGTWDLYEGKSTATIKSWNARQSDFDKWHYFSIKRSADGTVDAKIWERDNPENMFQFQGNLGPEWGMLKLTILVDFRQGTFMLDEYQELK